MSSCTTISSSPLPPPRRCVGAEDGPANPDGRCVPAAVYVQSMVPYSTGSLAARSYGALDAVAPTRRRTQAPPPR
jgi:hypothetical protein